MFSKRMGEHWQSLSFRLVLLYGGMFILSALVVFVIFYWSAESHVLKRVDNELLEDVDEIAELLVRDGLEGVKEEINDDTANEDMDEMFIRLLNRDGTEIIATDLSAWPQIAAGPVQLNRLGKTGGRLFETIPMTGKPYDARILSANIGREMILQTGLVLEDESRLLLVFKKVFGVTMLAVLILATLSGWVMARQALSGIEEVTQAAWKISKGAFGQRLARKNRGREVETLAVIFNEMLESIEKVIQEMKETNDNIAHDLKSPITRIRGLAEVTLTTESSNAQYRQMAASTIEECDNLLEMVNTMLDISEAEAGVGNRDVARLDMAGMVRDICDMFTPLAEKKGLTLAVSTPETCPLVGDVRKLQRLVANLLDNAVKYTPRPGDITVSLTCSDGALAVLSVTDTGGGIASEDLPFLFRRFYRCDQSRAATGYGLGLSLVKAIADYHSGQVDVQSRPGQGSTFTVTFPQNLLASPVDG